MNGHGVTVMTPQCLVFYYQKHRVRYPLSWYAGMVPDLFYLSEERTVTYIVYKVITARCTVYVILYFPTRLRMCGP